ncbi:wd40 repeat-containing protein : Ribosome assembly protein 4 (RSA4) OS=Anabaena variabilis (strain ATCC 29413 / PCC 7937) GN=Ava_1556 PE=4 SV=1: WD40 [Gemmataceae bacterium]|nr:wd40 repeat-containing protein : Ribosome assembly protein 4 (RSA4) OS=Anabaena variabilis (strain ATCC 29413 / PCC 7937) GN=Ava_1556 PE=4 SV=1: WD40 [Gemmataceae bacterium]VTU01580.1 wd40 repeat-containing protein : Ribosome assembly protein 4 (RSA4) OS=Anabaena variabilis (strain ATCC 29413 / PCC 7937) GN=Ava_1556 PE=4 SV=1: WD40 [Gemmataceae bacterium]
MLVLDGEPPTAALAFTPDGAWLVSLGGNGLAEMWSVPGGERLHRWNPFADPIHSLAVHPSGAFLLVTAGHRLGAIAAATGEVTFSVHAPAPLAFTRVLAAPSGAHVIAQVSDGRVRGFRFSTARGDFDALWEVPAEMGWLGQCAGAEDRFTTIDRNGLHVHSPDTGAVERTVKYPSNYVMTTAVSPDGSRLAVMGYEKLYVWDTATWGKPVRYACAGARRFGAMAFHPSRPLLATIQTGQTLVKFFDTETWKLAARFAWKLGEMRAVAFSPDGTLAAAGSVTGKIVIWDVDG